MKQKSAMLISVVALMASAPAHADWSHDESGISLPDKIGEMKQGEIRDISNGRQRDVMIQYGSGPLAVTIYVYKASYPNPALWFERTIAAMQYNVGGFDGSAKPTPITLAGAPRPNGLRETFEISNPNGHAGAFKSTSFALVQLNDWMLKLRISSQNLGKDEVDGLMDALISAISFRETVKNPLPLAAPTSCTDPAPPYNGKPLDPKNMEKPVAEGAIQGMAVMAEASGIGGPAQDPDKWCGFSLTSAPPGLGTAYREKNGGNFVILIGDAGRSLSAQHLLISGTEAKAGLFANVQGDTKLVWMFDGLPIPDQALAGGFRTILGQNEGLVTIGFGPKKDDKAGVKH